MGYAAICHGLLESASFSNLVSNQYRNSNLKGTQGVQRLKPVLAHVSDGGKPITGDGNAQSRLNRNGTEGLA
jgi:hypothetical protein